MPYKRLARAALLRHLERYSHVPAGTITIENCLGAKDSLVFALYSNYDLASRCERAERYTGDNIAKVIAEIKKGLDCEGFKPEGSRPRLEWHWDVKNCGYGYVLLVYLVNRHR